MFVFKLLNEFLVVSKGSGFWGWWWIENGLSFKCFETATEVSFYLEFWITLFLLALKLPALDFNLTLLIRISLETKHFWRSILHDYRLPRIIRLFVTFIVRILTQILSNLVIQTVTSKFISLLLAIRQDSIALCCLHFSWRG